MTKEYRARDGQIRDSVFKGNLKRAKKLIKHDMGGSARMDYRIGKSHPHDTIDYEGKYPGVAYNARGNRDEELALACLSSKDWGSVSKEEGEIRLKSAKIYHQLMEALRKPSNDLVVTEAALKNVASKYDLFTYGFHSPSAEDIRYVNKKVDSHLISEAYKAVKNKVEKTRRHSGLDSSLSSVLAIAGILGGLFFLSPNMTGNAIANVSQNSGNILGAVLLVVGLIAGFFSVKKR